MSDLRQQLQDCCRGRLCLVGIGNPDLADDAFGVRLAEALVKVNHPGAKVMIAGTAPEDCLSSLVDGQYDHVLFLDAVDFGATPGAVTLLPSTEIKSRFPQVSTHKLSLGLLARMIESNGHTQVWLLGVQPGSVRSGLALSPQIEASFDLLRDLLAHVLNPGTPAHPLHTQAAREPLMEATA